MKIANVILSLITLLTALNIAACTASPGNAEEIEQAVVSYTEVTTKSDGRGVTAAPSEETTTTTASTIVSSETSISELSSEKEEDKFPVLVETIERNRLFNCRPKR